MSHLYTESSTESSSESGSESSCSFVQPPPTQATATKTKKRPYTSVEGQDFASSRPFNSDERKLLDSMIDDDAIFDAKRKFNPKLPGGPAPVIIKNNSKIGRLIKCATLAIQDYNSSTQANYRFVNIEMATWQPVAGLLYHITFQGRNAEKEYRTFQATVFFNKHMIKVMNIRMKGSSTW